MELDVERFQEAFRRIADNVNTVIHGKSDVVRLALVSIFANGHILFDDVPGVGKSMLARALSVTMGADTARVQCTPDMLPGDITGSSVIESSTMRLIFKPGPVFTNVLLVDEINRATPKTQSALLEAMAERNVTVDGVPNPLPKPFLVLATQNPVEQAGTFPLPEAQLDRFLFRLKMGYPNEDAELQVMRGNVAGLEVESLGSVTTPEEIVELQAMVPLVAMPEAVERYILQLVGATRGDPSILLGASPRASITMARAARVMALADGRWTVFPEDVRALLRPVLAHRIMLSPDAILRGEGVDDVLDRVTNRVKAPLGAAAAPPPTPPMVGGPMATDDADANDGAGATAVAGDGAGVAAAGGRRAKTKS